MKRMNTPARLVGTVIAVLAACSLASPGAAAPRSVDQAPPPNMAAYHIGLLTRGPQNSTGDKAADEDLQARHIASLERRWREKTLLGAGPVLDGGDLRGLLIITADTLDRARAIAADDPAVQAGRLSVDVHPWWGPKDIGAGYAKMMQANPSAKPSMHTYQVAFLRRGPQWTPEQSPAAAALQERHMAHIREMGASGKLVAAGPFIDDSQLAGIFVFDTTAEEAKALGEQDPHRAGGSPGPRVPRVDGGRRRPAPAPLSEPSLIAAR